jgi:hypothetical protein
MKRIFRSILTVLALVLLLGGIAYASNLSHSYTIDGQAKIGSLISLSNTKANTAVLANSKNSDYLIGVAVSPNDSLLAVDPNSAITSVQVATSGVARTLVSSLNGSIRVGDSISTSPFNGVGMKASSNSRFVGIAQETFDTNTKGTSELTVTNTSGVESKILVGYIKVNIAVGGSNTVATAAQTAGLQAVVKSVTGHEVSLIRAAFIVIIALVATASLVVLTYASVYGGIVSIGRNPLAKFAVMRSVESVLAMAALIAFIAITTIFLLLR